MDALLLGLEQSAFGAFVRGSVWLYPFANIAHVLLILVFFTLVATMDVAVLRRSHADGQRVVAAARRPAALAFLLVAATGLILLTPEASAIARNPAFLAKMAAIALGGVNLALFTALRSPERLGALRASAAASLVLWLAVAACGRAIAYV